ncbi:MAG TPA: Pvc16 family protein [Blastococcus sp.]|nr:Pvc16 family protein [Blastococcus sp.]
MSASGALGMVSNSLRTMLVGEMELGLTVDVTVLAPDEKGSDRRVNLFLYRLEENPYLANQDAMVLAGTDRLARPPLSLVLFYLLTAYAPNDELTGNSTAHQILGEAMRVLHENTVVPRGYLDAGLQDAREDLQVVNKSLDPEELSRIWATFAQPFRLSVLYQVSTVQLDMSAARQLALPGRVRRIGVPAVRQPMARPVVSELTPSAGPAGTTLTFRGSALAGWRAGVRFGGRVLVEREQLDGDAVRATVPADVGPGFYDVRVDVAGLFRRTFPFEVTP